MRVLSHEEMLSDGASLGMPWASFHDESAWRDALRAHVAAEGAVLRRSLVERALRWHGVDHDEAHRDQINAWIDDLDAVGDILVGDGGLIGAAPLRAARIRGSSTLLLLGSVTTATLSRALPREVVEPRRVRRAVLTWHDDEALTQAMAALGGTVTDAERWAGLDRSPATLDAWWSALSQKRPRDADAAALADDLSAQRYVVRDGRGRWRGRDEGPSDEARLLRVRQPGGWSRFVWQSANGCVAITTDEALRTVLALDRRAGAPRSIVARSGQPGAVAFTLPARIPRAEYRMLLGTADRAEVDGAAVYAVTRDVWPTVATMLRERLGLTVDEVGVLA
jgi:hypothetical protein